MRRTAIILQHAEHESPGRIVPSVVREGLSVRVVRLFAGERPPQSVATGDVLVVMGGPMGVNDRNDPRFPFLRDEIVLLRAALADDTPVLGICLGAQLLAHTAGARVYPNVVACPTGAPPRPAPEVGWGPVTFLERGREPAVEGLGEQETVLHWHGDTFDLPSGAVLLASTERCRHQMFRLARAFGIQFHVELEAETVERWTEVDSGFVQAALGEHGAEQIRADTRRVMPAFQDVGDRLIANVLRQMLAG